VGWVQCELVGRVGVCGGFWGCGFVGGEVAGRGWKLLAAGCRLRCGGRLGGVSGWGGVVGVGVGVEKESGGRYVSWGLVGWVRDPCRWRGCGPVWPCLCPCGRRCGRLVTCAGGRGWLNVLVQVTHADGCGWLIVFALVIHAGGCGWLIVLVLVRTCCSGMMVGCFWCWVQLGFGEFGGPCVGVAA
jgi:hypothetical protein